MSRPRSRSPCYRLSPRWHDDRRDGGGRGPPRNFPSDRPDVDPHWNGPRFDNHRLRPKEDPGKPWAGLREEGGPGGRRRPSGSPPDPHRHRRAPLEELRRRTPSPSPFGSVDRRRLSPNHELRNRGRGRGGFGEDPRYGDQQREKFGEVAGSPQRLPRERLPSAGSRKTGGSQAGGAWGREEGRSRPRSPPEMSQDQRRERSGGELGRGGQGKHREDHNPPPPHQHPLHQRERSPFPERLRKELEDEVHHGYGMDKEPLRGRHGSLDKRPPAVGFDGGPLREGGAPQTLVVEHAHGMADAQRGEGPFRHAPRREPFGKRPREHGDGQDDGRERRPGLAGSSSQERFRMSDRRSKVRESQEKEEERLRGRPVHDHRRDLEFLARDLGGAGRERGARFGDDGTRQQSVRRIPPLPPPPLPPPPRQGRHNSPVVGFHGQEARMEVPPRGRHSPPGPGGTGRIPGRGGRLQGPPGSRDRTQARSHYHPQQQGPQHRPREDYARPSPRGEDWDLEPRDEHPLWGGDPEEPPTRHWDSLDGGDRRLPPQRGDPRCGPGTPRKRQAADGRWNTEEPETMATGKDRLTIKVDLNRTPGQNSQFCYSTDRQLSLDLVNVGRQRLDFLPMLEHSGTYRENAAHTGTFAQEIITLVHHVKDHYFHGNCVTLNQRFSGPQGGGSPDDEEEENDDEEEMVEERMTLNRRFNMNLNNGMSAGEHVHSRLGDLQPALRQHQMIHDPGDLRYDLERRRQERLGEVKVTIPGGSMSQRPLVHRSEREEEFVDGADMMPQEVWSRHQEQDGRRGGDTRPQRRGDPFLHPGPHKRSNHHGNQPPGPVRGQHRSHVIGAGW